MSDHTPAPWSTDTSLTTGEPIIRAVEAPDLCLAVFCETDPDGEESKANAARVVACVNACEGIDDPAATLAEVRDMLNMLSRMSLDDEIEGGMSGDDACETLGALIYKARSILAK